MTNHEKLIDNLSLMGIISQLPISLVRADGTTVFCSFLEEHHYWPPESSKKLLNFHEGSRVPYPIPTMYTLNLDYMLGVIACDNSEYIIIGPANTRKVSYEATISALSNIVSSKYITHFYSLYERSVPTSSMRFAAILAMIANDLHDLNLTPSEIISYNFDMPIVDTFMDPKPFVEETVSSVQAVQMLHEAISSDIASGNMDALKEHWRKPAISNVASVTGEWEDMLFFFIPFLTYMFQGALKGGVDIRFCLRKYLVATERFKSVKNATECIAEMERASYDFCELVLQNSGRGITPDICNECVNYINKHIREKITSSDLAAHCGIHRNKLYEIFRAHFGMTVGEYIEKERLRRSMVYLDSSNYSLSDIALTMGYTNQSHFTKIFKKHYGCTPGQYLKRRS